MFSYLKIKLIYHPNCVTSRELWLTMRFGRNTEIIATVIGFFLMAGVSFAQNTEDVINPIRLEAAVHSEKMVRSSQNGDTLVLNANAFQTMQGADSESLLSKMPGISVTDSGVEAAGKDVRRILLDGQEFFGEDALSALRTIPADLVKQVEVINRLSDNAQLTGVDDGEGYTAINIVTKRKRGDSVLNGRLYGSLGAPRKSYITGGNISRFCDKNTLNIIGMSNNINKFNFASSDIVSGVTGLSENSGGEFNVKSLPGISSVHSLGANFSNKKMNFIYFFNVIDNFNEQGSDKVTMTSKPERQQQVTSESDYNTLNMSHHLEGKMTLSPGSGHTFIIRPSLNVDNLSDIRNTYGLYRYIYSNQDPTYLRNQLNSTTNDKWTIRAGANISYRYAFKKKKRRSLSASANYNYYRTANDYSSRQYKFNEEDTDYDIEGEDMYNTYVQDKDNCTQKHTGSVSVTFTEPLTKRSRLSVAGSSNYNDTDGSNITSVMNNKDGSFKVSEKLSGVNRSIFLHNRLTGRYNYTLKKVTLTMGATYQHTLFNGEMMMPVASVTQKNFHHFLYQLTANIPLNSNNRIRVNAKASTSNPSNSMLQDVVNMSNTSNVRAGNPEIMPAYMHTADATFIHTNRKSGITFSITAKYTGSPNYFCDSLVINQPDFQVMEGVELGENNQFVKPVNLKGYRNISLKSSFSTPLSFIRCNFNISGGLSFKQMPSMINEDFTPIHTNRYNLGGRLDSNMGRNIDFRIGYSATYCENQYRGKYGMVQNNYLYQSVNGKIKWVFLKNFTFTGAAQYIQRINTEGLYNDKMVLCDLFIGHRFLKGNNLEISLGVNDLFNDNTLHIWHTVSASGVSDGTRIGLGRYFSLQCIWRFRNIKN